MNYRTAFWALLMLTLPFMVKILPMNNSTQTPTGPATTLLYIPPTQPQKSTFASMQDHLQRNAVPYTLLAAGIGLGALYYTSNLFWRSDLRERLQLDDEYFSNAQALKILTESVNTCERKFHNEKALKLTVGIKALSLSQDEKTLLQKRLDNFSLTNVENQEYETSIESLCTILKSYFALDRTRLRTIDETDITRTAQSMTADTYKQSLMASMAHLAKCREQLKKRLVNVSEISQYSTAAQELLARITDLSLELKTLWSLVSYVQLEELYGDGQILKEELAIAQNMGSNQPPIEQTLSHHIQTMAAPNNTYFDYELMLQRAETFIASKLDDFYGSRLRILPFQNHTIAHCQALVSACKNMRAYIRQHHAYNSELQHQLAAAQTEKQTLQNQLASAQQSLADAHSQHRYLYNINGYWCYYKNGSYWRV